MVWPTFFRASCVEVWLRRTMAVPLQGYVCMCWCVHGVLGSGKRGRGAYRQRVH